MVGIRGSNWCGLPNQTEAPSQYQPRKSGGSSPWETAATPLRPWLRISTIETESVCTVRLHCRAVPKDRQGLGPTADAPRPRPQGSHGRRAAFDKHAEPGFDSGGPHPPTWGRSRGLRPAAPGLPGDLLPPARLEIPEKPRSLPAGAAPVFSFLLASSVSAQN